MLIKISKIKHHIINTFQKYKILLRTNVKDLFMIYIMKMINVKLYFIFIFLHIDVIQLKINYNSV
jgi:hypothetical protein